MTYYNYSTEDNMKFAHGTKSMSIEQYTVQEE